jgi:peroxiredoxin family protein
MKKLAIIVTRGVYNNLLQACQLARIAAETGTQVSLLFRDEAAPRLTFEKVKELTFAEAYRGREAKVRDMLRERKLNDLGAVFRELKEKGDVKFSVCRDSLDYFDLRVDQLIPELDEVQKAEVFWKEEVAEADRVLTF